MKGVDFTMSRRKQKNNLSKVLILLVLILLIGVVGYFNPYIQEQLSNALNVPSNTVYTSSFDLATIPDYTDQPYVVLNDNKPDFEESVLTTESFEKYSDLDSLGRCG